MSDNREAVRRRLEAAEDITPPDEPPPSEGEVEFDHAGGALHPLNDLGNARRMDTYFGEDLIFVPRVGWFCWTGQRWEPDPDNLAVRRLGQSLSGLIEKEVAHVELDSWQDELLKEIPALKRRIAEIEAIEEEERSADQVTDLDRLEDRLSQAYKLKPALSAKRSAHRKFAKTTGNSDRIKKAVTEAEVMQAVDLEALDAEPLTINVENGILRFKVTRGEDFGAVADVTLDPHDRASLQSKIVNAIYDPAAEAPGFKAFLNRVQPDRDIREFLQRWFGLCLTALTGDQKLVFLYGHGANGKSVLVDLMASILGEYAATAKIESLTGQTRRGGADATPDLIPLMGARFVRASEPEQGEKLKESTIKELTGGEPILVRRLHSDFIEVKPIFKLTISGNYKPEIRGTDDGIWRRVLLVPFDVQIPKPERDPDLGKKLQAEAPGILRWMVEGLLAYLEGGLQEPDKVLEATKDYRSDSDPIGSFLTECCVVTGEESDFMLAREMIEAFNVWNMDREGSEWTGRTISLRLKDKAGRWRHPATGMTFIRGKRSATGYRGIKLTDTFAETVRTAAGTAKSGRRPPDEEVPV